ncbi:MAG: hypothetical protein H6854_04095 [Rhodospirillales bacterium]|nr:hypothetical protein [Rhodospirillales bacterium]
MTRSDSGVAIFYILLAVALFAALGFAFSNGMQDGAQNMTDEEGKVFAQDLISYASRLDRGVQRVLARGSCSENDLSFYLSTNTALAAYQHTPEVADACKVFHSDGGSITWLAPVTDVNDGTDWVFTGANRIAEVENDTAGAGNDLVAFLPNIDRAVCIKVNELLDIPNTGNRPPIENDDVLYTVFTGSFPSATYLQTASGELDGKLTGCFEANKIDGAGASSTYHFFHVLIAR